MHNFYVLRKQYFEMIYLPRPRHLRWCQSIGQTSPKLFCFLFLNPQTYLEHVPKSTKTYPQSIPTSIYKNLLNIKCMCIRCICILCIYDIYIYISYTYHIYMIYIYIMYIWCIYIIYIYKYHIYMIYIYISYIWYTYMI